MAHALSISLREHGSFVAKLVQHNGQTFYGTIVGLKGGYGQPQDNLVFVTVRDIWGAPPSMQGIVGMDVGTWELQEVTFMEGA